MISNSLPLLNYPFKSHARQFSRNVVECGYLMVVTGYDGSYRVYATWRLLEGCHVHSYIGIVGSYFTRPLRKQAARKPTS